MRYLKDRYFIVLSILLLATLAAREWRHARVQSDSGEALELARAQIAELQSRLSRQQTVLHQTEQKQKVLEASLSEEKDFVSNLQRQKLHLQDLLEASELDQQAEAKKSRALQNEIADLNNQVLELSAQPARLKSRLENERARTAALEAELSEVTAELSQRPGFPLVLEGKSNSGSILAFRKSSALGDLHFPQPLQIYLPDQTVSRLIAYAEKDTWVLCHSADPAKIASDLVMGEKYFIFTLQ